MSASPLQLIVLVYDRAIANMNEAAAAIKMGKDPRPEIDRAFRLVQHGLLNVLDYNAGEVAENLSKLYRWTLRQLLMVSMSRDAERLASIIDAFGVVRSGWQELLDQSAVSAPPGARNPQAESFGAQYSHRA
jgi:flagellar secretion chaperone FliS